MSSQQTDSYFRNRATEVFDHNVEKAIVWIITFQINAIMSLAQHALRLRSVGVSVSQLRTVLQYPRHFCSAKPSPTSPTSESESESASEPKSTSSTDSNQHHHHQDDDRLLHEKICQSVLQHVPHHGWTSLALSAGLHDVGLDSPASKNILPGGIASVALWVDDHCNKKLATHLQKTDKKEDVKEEEEEEEEEEVSSPPNRASHAMYERLELLAKMELHPLWYQAIALRPRLPRKALNNSLLLADEIAAYANYNSPDMSWYTDRFVLASIYQAAELYWLTDNSKDRQNTEKFIQARMHNAHAMRTSFSSSFARAMGIYNATTATASTLFRASRNSY